MNKNFATYTFTDSVKAAQEHYGSRKNYDGSEDDPDRFILTPREAAIITSRDSFYLSTVGENGWPYLQHRGGPKGFLRIINERTIGFADYKGNRQFISTGNLNSHSKALLFLMDYPTRQRVKIWAHGKVIDVADDPKLAKTLVPQGYENKAERLFIFEIQAYDWNCPQHITPRYTEEEFEALRKQQTVQPKQPI
ncbi:MAG: pyridoxamine 5'-phosphate oxidase family protein [Verrucomicrobiales bacterium]|nr:pyridoxamine 5'-phosphate oxidase family protein [Verrucomicrobiales bacterium]